MIDIDCYDAAMLPIGIIDSSEKAKTLVELMDEIPLIFSPSTTCSVAGAQQDMMMTIWQHALPKYLIQ